VWQIVLDLYGTIDIQSEIEAGIQVYVSIPLRVVKALTLRENAESMAEYRRKIAGIKACLINAGFDMLPTMSDTPSGILLPESEALILLKVSFRFMLTDWFGIEVVTLLELDFSQTLIHLVVVSKTMEEDIRVATAKFDGQGSAPIVVIICSIYWATNYVTDHGMQVFYL
jgi:hypothetical protein